MPDLLDKKGGVRKLRSFKLATIIQLERLWFCRRFITHDVREAGRTFFDPKGRQYDQMTQAAAEPKKPPGNTHGRPHRKFPGPHCLPWWS